MEKFNVIKPPGSLAELQTAAQNEPMERRGAKAIIENYAKRNDMTYEEAAKELGYKDTRAVAGMVARGIMKSDGNGGVSDKSVAALKAKKEGRKTPAKKETNEKETQPFTVEEEPIAPTGMTQKKFDALPDDTKLIVTAGMLRRMAEMIRAEERTRLIAEMRHVGLDEMLQIVA